MAQKDAPKVQGKAKSKAKYARYRATKDKPRGPGAQGNKSGARWAPVKREGAR